MSRDQHIIDLVEDFENITPGKYIVGNILINTKTHTVGVFDGNKCLETGVSGNYINDSKPSFMSQNFEDRLKLLEKYQKDKSDYIQELIKLKKSLDNILIKYI